MHQPTEDNLTDKDLIDRALINDPLAFRKIIERSEQMVAQIVQKMIDSPEDRKDMAQEIYLKAFRNLSNFKYQAKLSTWICQISYNACIDHLRKKKIRPLMLQDFGDDAGPESGHASSNVFISTGHLADNQVVKKELAGIVTRELEKLSPVYRTLITLFHQEEQSYQEIRQITGLPEGTIKSYLSRARKALKDQLLSNYSINDL